MGKEKILVVGCGGLGCELLKLLSLDTDNMIYVIDNDTIDATNLNRQFLFTSGDVNQSKSVVASRKLSGVTAIEDRIQNIRSIDFYRDFDVVYNCLDNNETRSYVNQRCYLAGVEMVDGGSAGWLGQSFNSAEECFDCLPKKVVREYPVCSVRQRPEIFEHCLVWSSSENLCNSGGCFDKIYNKALERAASFGIVPMDRLEAETFIKKIVPSVITTNAIVASLMVFSRSLKKNFYTVQSETRLIATELNKKRRDCATCAVPTFICNFDLPSTTSEFLDVFKAQRLIADDFEAVSGSSSSLGELQGKFAIVLKGPFKYRVFFERKAGSPLCFSRVK